MKKSWLIRNEWEVGVPPRSNLERLIVAVQRLEDYFLGLEGFKDGNQSFTRVSKNH